MKAKVSYLGVFLALALILSYVESLVPFFYGIPGMKLGLANLVTVFAFYYLGPKEAAMLSFVRVLLAGVLFGTGFSILYSGVGAICSYFMMYVLFKRNVQVLFVSACGGVLHNLGQFFVALFFIRSSYLYYYLPVLLCGGFLTGVIIGLLARGVFSRLPRNREG